VSSANPGDAEDTTLTDREPASRTLWNFSVFMTIDCSAFCGQGHALKSLPNKPLPSKKPMARILSGQKEPHFQSIFT
jgi:hypothetical protein